MVERLPYAVVGALLLALCDASGARAYCRTHTGDDPASDCPSACMSEGFALAWKTPNVDYVFNEKGFPGVSDSELRAAFERSFASWERVRCDSEQVGITATAKSGTTASLSGPPVGSTNENVIMHLNSSEWGARGYSPQAFAITAVWYNPNNGEILGADMMFNGLMDPFGVCPDTGCTRTDDIETDLQNVSTHEIGHLLGLSHSDVRNSTMWCDADSREISKRVLSADDIAGVCAIYPPGRDGGSGSGSNTGDDDGCQLGARTAPWGLAPLLALLTLVRLRRRRAG